MLRRLKLKRNKIFWLAELASQATEVKDCCFLDAFSISRTYPGESVGWSVTRTFNFPSGETDTVLVSQSVGRPQDVIYFLKAMTFHLTEKYRVVI